MDDNPTGDQTAIQTTAQTNTPQTNSIDINNTGHVQFPVDSSAKKSKIRGTALISSAVILIIILISFFVFRKAPNVKAQEYLYAVGNDMQSIYTKIGFYKGTFTDVSESMGVSKQAFYEMVTPNDYFSAVDDTKQDIVDINLTLDLINKSWQAKENLEVPEELLSFNQKLDSYYKKSEEALKLLLEFEEFQMQMLDASGDELNEKIRIFEDVINNPDSTRLDLENAVAPLVSLSEEAVERFEGIKEIPETEIGYYEIQKEYLNDLASTTKLLVDNLALDTDDGDYNFVFETVQFSERTIKRNENRQRRTEKRVEESRIKTLFIEVDSLESEIFTELDILLEKYQVKLNKIELIPTTKPELDLLSPKASPIPESSSSANISQE